MTTDANYALQKVKGIKESFDNGVKARLEQYMDNEVVDFYPSSEVFEIYTSTEGLSGSRELGSLETPPTLALEDGYSVTIYEKRFGGAMELPEYVYKRDGKDNTLKVDAYLIRQRNKLMLDNVHLMLSNAFDFLNDAFAGAKYVAPDAAKLIGEHTWKSGGTFDNSTTAKISEAAIDAALEYGGDFQDAAGKPMPIDFDTIIVKKGSPNSVLAKKLFAFGINPTAVADINIYYGTFKIIETPYITATNKNFWFMRDSRMENSLKLGIGIYPSMNEPIRQNNESIRSNVTGFWKQGIVNLPYDWYGSDGSAS